MGSLWTIASTLQLCCALNYAKQTANILFKTHINYWVVSKYYIYFTDRSTSTGNLLAQKQEQFFSLQCDLNEVSNGYKFFQGKMLKKLKPSETEKLALLLTRCNSKARNFLDIFKKLH